MKDFLIIISMGLWVVVLAAPEPTAPEEPPATDEGPLNLKPTKLKDNICVTEDDREGICVDESTCSEAFNIELGGIIDESELRIGTCPGEEWCCVHPNMSMFITKRPESSSPTPPPTPPPRGCRTGLKDACPWCVSVYRDNPRTKSSELFCGGAVVGSRLVLTTASCAHAYKQFDLWVRLPSTTRQYPVNTTLKHKQYISGTRENDIALLLLNEDVEWPEGRQDGLGACLGLRTPLAGDCVAIGFDASDQLQFTSVKVTANSCSDRGSTHDAACGRVVAGSTCSVAPGSPVLCPSGPNELIVAGLVRQTCQKDATLLGSLMSSAEWVSEALTNLTLTAYQYTIIR